MFWIIKGKNQEITNNEALSESRVHVEANFSLCFTTCYTDRRQRQL